MAAIKFEKLTKAYDHNAPVIQNLDLEIEEGSFTVLLGASGCGKSTLLRIVAGLEEKTAGTVYIGGEDMENVEPGDRHISMVFQNYALYPTMTVYDNIDFGLKNMKVPVDERKRRIADVAEAVGLSDFLDRKPKNLSGGQRQRVALARAIAKEPQLFLMDEPLSNLDAKLRAQIRTDLIELYRKLNTTFVYVTHDQIEALSMGTTIILLRGGEVQHMGSPTEIYERPANIYTAKFIGSPPMNVFDVAHLTSAPQVLGAKHIGFRPEKIFLDKSAVQDGDLTLHGDILARELLGDQILYKVKINPVTIVNIKTFNEQPLDYGHIEFYIKAQHLSFFDDRERRIDWGGINEI
ncbi:MAG: ABC transporter ATP-binding protein [Epulopiscium sp. Nuni2H_MBin001]|nr:MAG: ABC transporter ATP-binding protein [Epulopiscium sp. Nuni2H_MBin001]